ncbi:MAG: bifunctional diaminohydroxyphosphoribosylaminopyrimidine deaminase/5-amino-6-(5-phosphoribosylamino)uracil reductase RibD [Opitutales bacterium]|nr:bifunctional diaminohydroxyphosphoribosylaminopyrimidine deaminase/5-amino-6-(5-phosphoribosylamino)uracil reductase RibD [Opitutales bacterium]
MEFSTAEFDFFMRRAIELAKRGNGNTHPNPMVGALIVENGKIVAEGFHARAGTPHAERNALAALGRNPAPGATMFVTLEPCSTCGRTGACTDAIIASGISRVAVGATDPNPAHAGNGFAVLRAAGIEVVPGVLEDECSRLNPIFNHQITAGTPLFAMKTAMTLDGRTATRHGESQWITGTQARADVMRLRRYFPAIATGSGTVLADNPSLTARVSSEEVFCPTRFVFDRRLRTLEKLDLLNVFNDEFREKTVLVTTAGVPADFSEKLSARGVKTWEIPTENFWVDFRSRVAGEYLGGVLFEAGAELLGSLLSEKQANYLYAYIAPKIFGDPAARPAFAGTPLERLSGAQRLSNTAVSRHGNDILFEGKIEV